MQADGGVLYSQGEIPYGSGLYSESDNKEALAILARIRNGEKDRIKWEYRFKCSQMEDYYEGKQWEETGSDYTPYVLNLIYSSIEVQLPTLLFTNPEFSIKAKPASSAFDFTKAAQKAQLRSDIINTFVESEEMDFSTHAQLSVRDAFFRFGIVEVGYSADWSDNPNANKPILRSDTEDTPFIDREGNVLKQPKKLPSNERIFIKRLPPENFTVSSLSNGGLKLRNYDWCSYWEWMRIEDILANENFSNRDKIHWAGGRSSDFIDDSDYSQEIKSLMQGGDLARVRKFFDNRNKTKYTILDSPGITLKKEKFKRLPLFTLRFSLRSKGFYPLPPASNWKSPQDEYNETREQARNHRRRFIRKFLYMMSAFSTAEEKDKLMHGGDGTFIGVEGDPSTVVFPVPNADLGPGADISLQVSREDFNLISGTTSEATGLPQKATATQSNIINSKSQIRSSLAKILIANWLSDIGEEILLQVEEKITQPLWVKMAIPGATKAMAAKNVTSLMGNPSADPNQMQDMQAEQQQLADMSEIWHEVSAEDLDNDNSVRYHVSVLVDSMSPLDQGNDSQTFIAFLSVLAQFPEIASDPDLIKEAAYRIGYRNDKIINKMIAAAQLMLAQKLAAGQKGGGNNGGGSPPQMAQQTVANAQPPAMEQMQNQLNNSQTAQPLQ